LDGQRWCRIADREPPAEEVSGRKGQQIPANKIAGYIVEVGQHQRIVKEMRSLAAQRSSPQRCAHAGCWQRAELRIAGAAAQTRGVSAEFGYMVLRFELSSTNNPAPRPLAIPLRTKRKLAAECAGL
jgi:hypothetical protein